MPMTQMTRFERLAKGLARRVRRENPAMIECINASLEMLDSPDCGGEVLRRLAVRLDLAGPVLLRSERLAPEKYDEQAS